jgi:two-component system chemotaxis response regulator CheB
MTVADRVRVLIVDDSAFARKVLRRALSGSPRIEVVGIAADGLEALEKISELQPDVVTLDLIMPNLDGVGVLRELAAAHAKTRVVLVSMSDADSELMVEALALGAVDLVKKPTALASDRLYELSDELVQKVLAAADARPWARRVGEAKTAAVRASPTTGVELIVIGTSTGGPAALTQLLSALPRDFPTPIAIGLHIPADYTNALAKRLDQESALHVIEASDGVELRPGLVVLAKGGAHLKLHREGTAILARLSTKPSTTLYYPSIDILFQSAAGVAGANTLGVVMTGMGEDGLIGARSIVDAGGRVLTEAESSCVVYGMPRAVRDAGLSAGEADIGAMAEAIIKRL